MKKLKKEFGFFMIFIIYDFSIFVEISDCVVIMYVGKIVEIGDSEKIYYELVYLYI